MTKNVLPLVLAAAALASAAVAAAAQQAQAPAQPGESPYRAAARLPARITSLTIEPTTIQPGQSVTLRWSVENPTTVSLDPLGRVAPEETEVF